MDVCCAFYHRVNDDVFETFLRTFRKVSGALLQVYSDNVPKELQEKWSNDYQVEWRELYREEVRKQRCYRRMKCVDLSLIELIENDRMIFCDVDLYFLDDPFTAFDKRDFDIGVTLRLHSYKFPVNSGIFFIRPTNETKVIFRQDFQEYANNQEDQDWGIDQNYLNKLYKDGKAVDVGWEYNFCPNTDVYGVKLAADMIKRAYESKSVKVLHLKSELKMCIYQGYLEDAVAKYANGGWNWQKEGK